MLIFYVSNVEYQICKNNHFWICLFFFFTSKPGFVFPWKMFLILWGLSLCSKALQISHPMKMLSQFFSNDIDTSLPLGCIGSIMGLNPRFSCTSSTASFQFKQTATTRPLKHFIPSDSLVKICSGRWRWWREDHHSKNEAANMSISISISTGGADA